MSHSKQSKSPDRKGWVIQDSGGSHRPLVMTLDVAHGQLVYYRSSAGEGWVMTAKDHEPVVLAHFKGR